MKFNSSRRRAEELDTFSLFGFSGFPNTSYIQRSGVWHASDALNVPHTKFNSLRCLLKGPYRPTSFVVLSYLVVRLRVLRLLKRSLVVKGFGSSESRYAASNLGMISFQKLTSNTTPNN